ncbi:UspA domain-containing protein [halophilic archaeon DL31]|jgi:nucleotide-binding universal stress UspA family protein|nr:UspA domain-containing protein [halophilic archaeon DL31]
MAPLHVLVPLDGSPLAAAALEHALETAVGEVTVLNVVTPLDGAMSEGGVLEPGQERRASARERADRLISRARQQVETVDRTVETAVETGDPAEAILDFVESSDVDHVIMGGHGGDRGEIRRRLLGTVATTVVSEAPVTVTVVR